MNTKLTLYAQKALYYEVLVSPKPGLVDRLNNGSHYDMDIFTFIEAIDALTPFFSKYLNLGFLHEGSPKELFIKARLVGQDAETAMMKATNEVNTHKGANFTFAIVLAASAYLLKEKQVQLPFTVKDTGKLFQYIASMSEGLVTHDFKDLDKKPKLSYGENLYLEHGISGIRGVAENGYPIITKIVMPYLREQLQSSNQNIESVLLHALSLIMSEAEDTNLIHRGGIEAYEKVREDAKLIFETNSPETIKEAFNKYDEELIEQHLSPGGAADLLSLSIYMAQLESLM